MYTNEAPGPTTTRLGPGELSSLSWRDQSQLLGRRSVVGGPAVFPIDLLEALEYVWRSICQTYDLTAALPETQALFEGVDPSLPNLAAETIVANMLLEAMENIPRFSEWYTRPLGLRRIQAVGTARGRWSLSPATYQHWRACVESLAIVIEHNVGLLLAADLIGDLIKATGRDAARVMARCDCLPPRVILVNRSALAAAEIVCDTCERPFYAIENSNDDSV
jgi:hypothetical protein